MPPTEVLQFTLPPSALPWLHAVAYYLRQNLLIFLHTPKYTDSNVEHHFKVRRAVSWDSSLPSFYLLLGAAQSPCSQLCHTVLGRNRRGILKCGGVSQDCEQFLFGLDRPCFHTNGHLLCKKQQPQSSRTLSSPRSMGEDPLAKLSLAAWMTPSNLKNETSGLVKVWEQLRTPTA